MREEEEASEPVQDAAAAVPRPRRHSRGLLLVGLYKVSEAVLSALLGAGALHYVHRDVAQALMQLLDALRVDPESRLVGLLMDRADLIGGHQLREFSMVTFVYAGLHLTEGIGLMLEKTWAEYFTVILTAMGLPWESYELWQRFTAIRLALLIGNIGVLLYVLWVLKQKKVPA